MQPVSLFEKGLRKRELGIVTARITRIELFFLQGVYHFSVWSYFIFFPFNSKKKKRAKWF